MVWHYREVFGVLIIAIEEVVEEEMEICLEIKDVAKTIKWANVRETYNIYVIYHQN